MIWLLEQSLGPAQVHCDSFSAQGYSRTGILGEAQALVQRAEGHIFPFMSSCAVLSFWFQIASLTAVLCHWSVISWVIFQYLKMEIITSRCGPLRKRVCWQANLFISSKQNLSFGERKWWVALRYKLSFIYQKGNVFVLLEEVSGGGEERRESGNFFHCFLPKSLLSSSMALDSK